MNEFIRTPVFEFYGIEVIESENCLQTWQLTDFTKELMGRDWVKKFDAWAEHALPKQPAYYMMGENKMIVHPLISKTIRDEVQSRSKIRWMTAFRSSVINPTGGLLIDFCSA